MDRQIVKTLKCLILISALIFTAEGTENRYPVIGNEFMSYQLSPYDQLLDLLTLIFPRKFIVCNHSWLTVKSLMLYFNLRINNSLHVLN